MPLSKEKKRKLRTILGTLKPSEKGELKLDQFKEDTQENLLVIFRQFSERMATIELSLLAEFNKKISEFPKPIDLTQDIKNLKNDFENKVQSLTNNLKQDNGEEVVKKLKKDINKKIDSLRVDFLGKIAGLGGGQANRQINVNSSIMSTRYNDINFKDGTDTLLTTADNNTTKQVDVTIASSGVAGATRELDNLQNVAIDTSLTFIKGVGGVINVETAATGLEGDWLSLIAGAGSAGNVGGGVELIGGKGFSSSGGDIFLIPGAGTPVGNIIASSNIISDTDIVNDLGTGDLRWRDVYPATLRSGLTDADTLLLQARDVDGSAWTTFGTLTSANTPTFVLASDVTGTTQSASDNSTKLATTAYVDAGGGGQTLYEAIVDAAGGGDYTTIEGAFADSKTVVFVRNGTYNPASDIDIPNGGKLTGESRDGVIIDFQDEARKIAIATGLDDITLENFTIQNSQPGTTTGAINFVNTDRSIVRNVHFAGGNDQGIEFTAGRSNIVTQCHFGVTAGANDGIHIKITSQNTVVSNNTGVDLDQNFAEFSAIGGVLVGNTIEVNTTFRDFCTTTTNATEFVASGNTCLGCEGFIINESDVLIVGNTVKGGSTGSTRRGVKIGGSGERTVVVGNFFTTSGIGVEINSGADNCLVTNNWFRDMSTRAIDNSSPNSYIQGNYGVNEGERAIDEKKIMWMKNTSGGQLVLGDLVTYKAVAAGDEYTTTTTQGDDLVYGMVLETTADTAYGKVQVIGKTTALKVDGTTDIAIGDFIGTFTTATIGQKAAAGDMAIAIALEAYTTDDSAGVIDALLITPRKI